MEDFRSTPNDNRPLEADRIDPRSVALTVFDDFECRLSIVDQLLTKNGFNFAASRMGAHFREFKQFLESRRSGGELTTLTELKCVHQALDDLEELELIVQELGSHGALSTWRPKLEMVMGGRVFPEHDNTFSPARDTQFELYFAAVSKRAGFSVELEEPDVILSEFGRNIAAALKRVKSPAKLVRRIHEADRQLRCNQRRGVVVMDISSLVNPRNRGIATEDMSRGIALAQKLVDQLLEENADSIRRAVDPDSTYGVLSHFKVMGFFIPNLQFFTVRYLRMAEMQSSHRTLLEDLLHRLRAASLS